MMRVKRLLRWGAAIMAIAGSMAFWYSGHPEIAAVTKNSKITASSEMIARGKMIAAMGDCAVCHTSKKGITNAGGLPIKLPFGIIYTTNITPDVETGIGRWSFAAFKRAMREGIDREGHYLYPAFPYTAFTKISDSDLAALYAYLMSQTPVKSHHPQTNLSFPFNIRRGIAAWNLLFFSPSAYQEENAKTAGLSEAESRAWQRGAYLVEGPGHCSACHTPRNLMFAEKGGDDYLSGGIAEGWVAPALNNKNPSPMGWSKDELMDYMRTGYSVHHGVASGPMKPVINEGLSTLDEANLAAIATYVLSFKHDKAHSQTKEERRKIAIEINTQAYSRIEPLTSQGARIFSGACMACHNQSGAPVLNSVNPSLALNSNLYEATPDNMIYVILDGIKSPATKNLGYMPAFRYNMNDRQIAALLAYLREDFARQPAWPDLMERVKALRDETEKNL